MSTLNSCKKDFIQLAPDWTMALCENHYHGASLRGEFVSSGMLKEFRNCPAYYHALIRGWEKRRTSGAFRVGRALHALLLEGEAVYRAAYSVGGPVNEKIGRVFGADSKAFGQWLDECGMDRERTLTPAEAESVWRMRDAARTHLEIARLLDKGWPELSVRANIGQVACQARLDWLRPDGMVVDVKTTADIDRFESDARRLGYLHQFAFYHDVSRAAGAGKVEMAAVVLEKKAPFRAGVWKFPWDILAPYSAQNRLALASLQRCREKNCWPTGYENSRKFPPAGIPPLWLN